MRLLQSHEPVIDGKSYAGFRPRAVYGRIETATDTGR